MIGVTKAKEFIVNVFKFLRKMTGYQRKPKPFEMYNRLHKMNTQTVQRRNVAQNCRNRVIQEKSQNFNMKQRIAKFSLITRANSKTVKVEQAPCDASGSVSHHSSLVDSSPSVQQ